MQNLTQSYAISMRLLKNACVVLYCIRPTRVSCERLCQFPRRGGWCLKSVTFFIFPHGHMIFEWLQALQPTFPAKNFIQWTTSIPNCQFTGSSVQFQQHPIVLKQWKPAGTGQNFRSTGGWVLKLPFSNVLSGILQGKFSTERHVLNMQDSIAICIDSSPSLSEASNTHKQSSI